LANSLEEKRRQK